MMNITHNVETSHASLLSKTKRMLCYMAVWLLSMGILQGQHITQVEYWLGNNFRGAVTKPVTMSGDVAALAIPYDLTNGVLQAGKPIYYRFKDSRANWSVIFTQPVVAQTDENTIRTMYAEYWFNDDFDNRKVIDLTDILADTDGTWGGQMADLPVPVGTTTIHYRFKSAYNNWSAVVTNQLNVNDRYATYNRVEYWFDNDFAGRQTVSLDSTLHPQDSGYLKLFKDITWKKGKHNLHYRFLDNIDRITPVFTYYADERAKYSEYVAVEYWFDNDFATRQKADLQKHTDPATGYTTYYNNAITWENGKRSMFYRFLDNIDRMTPVFMNFADQSAKNIEYAAVEYWFDNDFATRQKADLQKHTDPATGYTSYYHNALTWQSGKRKMFYRFLDNRKLMTLIYQYVSYMAESHGNKIVEAEYWFNDRFEERFTKDITATRPIFIDSLISEVSLPTDTVINIRYQDAVGNWSSIANFNLKSNSGKYNILTLNPDINELVPSVVGEGGMPVYSYLITDAGGNAVENVYLAAQINGHTLYSTLSDKHGLIKLPVPLYGNNVKESSDDWVPVGSSATLTFKELIDSQLKPLATTTILNNEFKSVELSVRPTDVSQMKMSIRVGGGAKAKIGKIASAEAGIGLGTSIIFYNDDSGSLDKLGVVGSFDASLEAKISTPKTKPVIYANGGLQGSFKASKKIKLDNSPLGYAQLVSNYLNFKSEKTWGVQLFEFGLNKLLEEYAEQMPLSESEISTNYGYKFNLGANYKLLNLPISSDFNLVNNVDIGFTGEIGGNWGWFGEKTYSQGSNVFKTQIDNTNIFGKFGADVNGIATGPGFLTQPGLFANMPSNSFGVIPKEFLWKTKNLKTLSLFDETERLDNNTLYKLKFRHAYGQNWTIVLVELFLHSPILWEQTLEFILNTEEKKNILPDISLHRQWSRQI